MATIKGLKTTRGTCTCTRNICWSCTYSVTSTVSLENFYNCL